MTHVLLPVGCLLQRADGVAVIWAALAGKVGGLVFAEGWLQAGNRQPVLALAHPVAAGQVITAADLARVSDDHAAWQGVSPAGKLFPGPLAPMT